MRKGFQNVFELTAVSGILLSVATVALLTMSNSKGTGFIGEDVLDAYKSKGVVAAFQTAGHEIGHVMMGPLMRAQKDMMELLRRSKGIYDSGVIGQSMKDFYQATKAPFKADEEYRKMVEKVMEKQRAALLSDPSFDLDDGHYGPIVPVQLQGTPKVSKKVHLKPSPDEVKRRPRQAALEGKAL